MLTHPSLLNRLKNIGYKLPEKKAQSIEKEAAVPKEVSEKEPLINADKSKSD
jgi:hypothetical protein